jgi:hypothetical protein
LIGELRPEGPTGTSQFPICSSPGVFDLAKRSQLAGLPTLVTAAIEQMQAYGPSPDHTTYTNGLTM